MKLKNKITGEIMDDAQYRNYSLSDGFGFRMGDKEWEYHSLAELNAEWCDYEEAKYYYAITRIKADDGITKMKNKHNDMAAFDKSIGNYFETKEEAEKAVEKLRAFKRLEDKGFRFDGYDSGHNFNKEPDLDLLFGGEEMKELRFRAWSIKKRKYIDIDTLYCANGEVCGIVCSSVVHDTEDVILEQYTGLKDENGKEIYEGDIVTMTLEFEKLKQGDCKVISFRDGCFRIGNDYEDEAGLYLQDWRVIGNIHEDKELLGGKE